LCRAAKADCLLLAIFSPRLLLVINKWLWLRRFVLKCRRTTQNHHVNFDPDSLSILLGNFTPRRSLSTI